MGRRNTNGGSCSVLGLAVVIALVAAGMALPACGHEDSSDHCRFHPEECHHGEAGAFCDSDDDCIGFCCTEGANCGGGMCTFECSDDLDCPSDMACEHDMCFYSCEIDDDCADGQRCEHDGVCEWP